MDEECPRGSGHRCILYLPFPLLGKLVVHPWIGLQHHYMDNVMVIPFIALVTQICKFPADCVEFLAHSSGSLYECVLIAFSRGALIKEVVVVRWAVVVVVGC